ncbi:YkgJ family cysteine cluster protein [Clostridiaceae bacterium]|nr:YkgJ family cysteine cluster protein [Clostridiaceae bacterium]RKI18288.1 YkgJ family cysteine cluster protein [bacterium 1XD21-70]
MKRQVDLAEISDGRRYGANDMVKADCGGCEGCSSCCEGMGKSVILDPYDVQELAKGLSLTFEQLLASVLELNVADGLILPNLKMAGEQERCGFLDGQGRCRVHPFRPGFCRMFPLGRIYEGDGFWYFLQVQECRRQNRGKVKVRKWIGVPEFSRYEKFVLAWHGFLKKWQGQVCGEPDGELARSVCMRILKEFYLRPFDGGRDFYGQFEERVREFG